jgi:SAM-dependent methyltransferase
MGEIIPRPLPQAALPFTGERLTSDFGGQTQIEHFHRYLLAREWCRGKDILDVASGEGYGTALLAQVARSAVGVEIAPDAVAHAAKAYGAANLSYVAGDARAIPAADATFDVVVSFETIEHFAEQTEFVTEIRRVLRPEGLLIVSTPDRDNYSPAETPANPYHVKELTGAEFETLLRGHFFNISILLQRPIFGSVLLPAQCSKGAPLCFERRGDQHFEGSSGLSRPQYLIAFASNNPAAIAPPPSVYIDTGRLGMLSPPEAEARLRSVQIGAEDRAASAQGIITELKRQVAAADDRAVEIEALRVETANARGEVRGLLIANETTERACEAMRSELAAANRTAAEAQTMLRQAQHSRAGTEAEALSLQQELERVKAEATAAKAQADAFGASTSWRLTAPVRAVSRLLRRKA